MSEELSFKNLVEQVEHVHNITSSYAKNAINQLPDLSVKLRVPRQVTGENIQNTKADWKRD
mgnify:CR=1 FL=1